MHTLQTIDSSVLALLILLIIRISAAGHSGKGFWNDKLFIGLLRVNMGLLIIDILGWEFNGLPGMWNLILNWGFNFLLFITAVAPSMIWFVYAHLQVFHDENRIRRYYLPLAVFFVANALLALSSFYTHWYFWVDQHNIYHRGMFFWIHLAFNFFLIYYAFLIILLNRNRIEKQYYHVLLLFFLPPTLGSALQTFFYGVSFTWSGMMLSLLLLYMYVQNHDLNRDYLTGVYNRRELDQLIRRKIHGGWVGKSFAVIFVDLDDFKQINDRFGHDAGDAALQDAVKVIRGSIRQDDLIARYGGDEFYIILDLNSPELLEAAVARINESLAQFNRSGKRPYQLSFSMGYDIYNYDAKTSADDFLRQLDNLMYQNKCARKNKRADRCAPPGPQPDPGAK